MIRIAVSIVVTLALAVWPAIVFSQNESGQITIAVTDASTNQPIGLARVLLDGPIMTNELTTQNGKVIFRDVPAGVYTARVGKSGYQTVTTAAFEVIDGKAVDVNVQLAAVASGVKSLGTITVKSTASISTTAISQDSAIRKLSPTLNDALNKLSGVSAGADSATSDSAQTISLEGHDPSQTQVALDGIPLSAPGSASDLRFISSDLFAGASVSFSPVAGALGGSVNYRTLEPTRNWLAGLTQSFGNLNAASTIVSLQGSAGNLGVAYVHSIRGSENQLAGQRYLDASGFDYIHQGANQSGGDLIKLRTLLGGTHSLSAMFASSNGYNDALCTVESGLLPCGYGPGNSSYRHYALGSVSDTALVGMTTMQLSVYGSQYRNDRDFHNRFINLVSAPFGQQTTGSTRGVALSAHLPSRERHTISFQVNTTSSNSQSTALVPSVSVFASGSSSSSYSAFSVGDSIRSNDKLTLGEHVGVARSNGMGASLLAGISANWAPGSSDAFAGNLDFGSNGSGPARFGVLSDPAALLFDCAGDAGFGSGPGDTPGNQSGTTARAAWQHTFGSIGQLTTTLYHQQQNDSLINALVNGSAFPPGYFPPGYFTSAQQIFQSTGGCASPTAAFGPTNLYLTVPVSGVTMVYEGIRFDGDFTLTRSLALEPFWSTQVVKPISGSALLANPFSPVISGSQLPGAPLHQAGVTLDLKPRHSPLEWLADARYVSSGNRNYLPGYVTADAGAAMDFTHGTLTVALSNIFNKFGYEFASPSFAQGPPTVDEGILPQIARPLSPRQLTVTYSVKIGYGQGIGSRSALGPSPSAAQSATTGGARQGGRGLFAGMLELPQSPPSDPFAVAASRPSCDAASAAQASQTLSAMKAYATAIESQKTSAGYPAQMHPLPPDIPGFTAAYHPMQNTYALTFTPQTFLGLRGFMGCAPIHVGTKDQADAMHLYIPQASSFFRAPLVFSPAAGLYIVRQPPPPGQEQFRVYKLPSSKPAQPLQIVDSTRCTSDFKPVAQQLLASLSLYLNAMDAGQASPAQPAGWLVTPHNVAKGYWLELQPQAPTAIPALLNCARIAAGSADEIKATGYGAAELPALNYAPALGLYIQRRQPAAPAPGT